VRAGADAGVRRRGTGHGDVELVVDGEFWSHTAPPVWSLRASPFVKLVRAVAKSPSLPVNTAEPFVAPAQLTPAPPAVFVENAGGLAKVTG
jgi:hypothetical protein